MGWTTYQRKNIIRNLFLFFNFFFYPSLNCKSVAKHASFSWKKFIFSKGPLRDFINSSLLTHLLKKESQVFRNLLLIPLIVFKKPKWLKVQKDCQYLIKNNVLTFLQQKKKKNHVILSKYFIFHWLSSFEDRQTKNLIMRSYSFLLKIIAFVDWWVWFLRIRNEFRSFLPAKMN